MLPPFDTRAILATRRAVALAVVLLVTGFMAVPMPHALSEKKLARPTYREEVDRWHEVVAGLGVPLDRDGFDQVLISVTGTLSRFRGTVLKPVVPFTRLTGTGQSWYLFTAPDRKPRRLEIEIRGAEGPWRTVHRGHDAEHAWAADALAYRRIRAVYDSSHGTGPGWRRFTQWIAARAFADFPEAERVRVSFVETRSKTPREAPDASERRIGAKAWTRETLAEAEARDAVTAAHPAREAP